MFDISKFLYTQLTQDFVKCVTFSFAWDQSMKVDHFEIRCGLCTITRYLMTVK